MHRQYDGRCSQRWSRGGRIYGKALLAILPSRCPRLRKPVPYSRLGMERTVCTRTAGRRPTWASAVESRNGCSQRQSGNADVRARTNCGTTVYESIVSRLCAARWGCPISDGSVAGRSVCTGPLLINCGFPSTVCRSCWAGSTRSSRDGQPTESALFFGWLRANPGSPARR